MSTRLDCIYQMIPKGGRGIIDVGTDHALIPIRLAENNYQGTIFASDIADAPLALAKRTAIEHKAEKKIRFQCCDGLEQCPSDEVDTILIAGMGGDSICGILDRTEWLFSGDYCLILQPMTQAAVVRYWLVHNGFRINQEKLVQEGRHIYQVFLAFMGNSEGMMDSEYLIGRRNAGQDQKTRNALIQLEWNRLRKKTEGLMISGHTQCAAYCFYKNMMEELEDEQENAHCTRSL